MKTAVVLGAGGFIGSHLVRHLRSMGYYVRAADLRLPAFSPSPADEFLTGDLRDLRFCEQVIRGGEDEIYQLAAEMGGAGFLFSGDNDAAVMHNSAQINLNVLSCCVRRPPGTLFFSSSACIYPEYNQLDPSNPKCSEDSAYPAQPDSEYGWEKLFSERMYLAYARNHGLRVRIARFHNVFGPEGVFQGGREKAPAAICRKVAQAAPQGEIEIWGDGLQTRSFLYITDCLAGIRALMDSGLNTPVNIGSEERISLNEFAQLVMQVAGKPLAMRHIPGPQGVRGRTSDNRIIREATGWSPRLTLRQGVEHTYRWIEERLRTA